MKEFSDKIDEKPDFLFYSSDVNERVAVLNEDEAFHCVKVMRQRKGDVVWITDGKGALIKGILTDVDIRKCVVEITECENNYGNSYARLRIAVAPPKNPSRFEWFLEKATEVGISSVKPLICKRSYKTEIKRNRSEKIVLSAMKQSLNTLLPSVENSSDFISFCNEAVEKQKFIAVCGEGNKHLINECAPGIDTVIAIGPEGDFTQDEVDFAISKGFVPVNLGRSRLRTETAALVACVLFSGINNS